MASSANDEKYAAAPLVLYGPFHRVKSPTQSYTTSKLQQESKQIWGRARQFSDIPQVQAYDGPLPPDDEGIEFHTANIPPDKGTAPGHVRWTGPRDGVVVEDGYAKLTRVIISKNTQKTPPDTVVQQTDQNILIGNGNSNGNNYNNVESEDDTQQQTVPHVRKMIQ